MRTDIDLDDKRVAKAMAATGLPSKNAAVEEAMHSLVRRHRQKAVIANLVGPGWQGDLDAMCEGRAGDRPKRSSS